MECNGKVHAIAMMKMVFLNAKFQSVAGKEPLTVMIAWLSHA